MIFSIGGDSVDLGLQSRGSGSPKLRFNQSQEYAAGADSSDVIVYTVTWPLTETAVTLVFDEITATQYAQFQNFFKNIAVGATNSFSVTDDDLSEWTGRFTGEDISPTAHGLRNVNGISGIGQAYGLTFNVLKYA